MPEIVPTPEEIEAQYDEAAVVASEGTQVPMMSYEDGVRDALSWVLGNTDEKPMEEE